MNYQERVSTRADVRALYEKVIANPAIARYRGYTESKSYGWDASAEEYIKKEGEVWFENPSYDAAMILEEEIPDSEAELSDEQPATQQEQLSELEALVTALKEENDELEQRAADAEARAMAAENERDEVKEALLELRRAMVLVAELAGVK